MSIELLLDEVTDARLRSEWARLLAADLPSQARHTGASNAPHITLLAAAAVGVPSLAAVGVPSLAALAALAAASSAAAAGLPGPAKVAALAPGSATAAAAGLPGSLLPIEVTVGGFVVFGAAPRSLVLARPVVVTEPLLQLHAAVHAAAARLPEGVQGLSDVTAVGQWMPHITLASRLTPDQLARAVELLSAAPDPDPAAAPGGSPPSRALAARHWNGTTRTITPLS